MSRLLRALQGRHSPASPLQGFILAPGVPRAHARGFPARPFQGQFPKLIFMPFGTGTITSKCNPPVAWLLIAMHLLPGWFRHWEGRIPTVALKMRVVRNG